MVRDSSKRNSLDAGLAKPSSDQNMRALENHLEILDAQIAEIEARQVVRSYLDDQRALIQKFRRKLN
jgi:hypothetical protein